METPISSYIVDLMVRVLTLEPHFAEVPRGRRKTGSAGWGRGWNLGKIRRAGVLVIFWWHCADIVVILWWYCGDIVVIWCWYCADILVDDYGDEHEKTGVWRLISNMMRICCVPLGATKGRPRNPPPAPRPGTRSGRVSSARRTDRCLSARLGTGWKQHKHWGYLVICPLGMEHLDEKLMINMPYSSKDRDWDCLWSYLAWGLLTPSQRLFGALGWKYLGMEPRKMEIFWPNLRCSSHQGYDMICQKQQIKWCGYTYMRKLI